MKTEISHKWPTEMISVVKPCLWTHRIGRTFLLGICLLLAAGCRQDMQNQPKFKPLRPNPMFDDGGSAGPLVEGTVPRASARDGSFRPSWLVRPKLTVTLETNDVSNFTQYPIPLTRQILDREKNDSTSIARSATAGWAMVEAWLSSEGFDNLLRITSTVSVPRPLATSMT